MKIDDPVTSCPCHSLAHSLFPDLEDIRAPQKTPGSNGYLVIPYKPFEPGRLITIMAKAKFAKAARPTLVLVS